MTFRPPLCNVRHITEWVQQELICPGDWLGDWAIVHVLSEAGRSLKWASEWVTETKSRCDEDERRLTCSTASFLLGWPVMNGCNLQHKPQRRQHDVSTEETFLHSLISLLTSSLYYWGLKTCCMMYFKIQSLFVFMPLQRFWGNFFTFSSSSSSVTSWRPVLVNTLSISNFGTKVNMDWRMNWLDCGGQRFIIKRSKVCDLVIIQRHSSETPAWCVHGGVQPWCSNYNKLVKMCRFDSESEPKPQSNSQINSE